MDGDEFDYQLSSNGETILDSAMNVGADVPYSCKGGVCCTCKSTKVIEGKPDDRELFIIRRGSRRRIYFNLYGTSNRKIVVDFDEM